MTLRELLGASILEAPTAIWNIARGDWLRLCNRTEKISRNPNGGGWKCEFEWSQILHVTHVFPAIGNLLMRRAFNDWPINLQPGLGGEGMPEVSFILPFRGRKRLPQLLTVLQSIAGQEGIALEAIVVEQDQESQIRADLPAWVKHIHLPHPQGDLHWRKCWAFNVGAQMARGRILICHDADIVCPSRYALEAARILDQGYESAYLQRFKFFLSRADSETVCGQVSIGSIRPDSVQHNWVGGTLAIKREQYEKIGGFDERFLDWTGEDVEFFDRCRAMNNYEYGFIPFIHLWHEVQPSSVGALREKNLEGFREVMKTAPLERIRQLKLQQLRKDG
jgi:hypothetical protein